MLKLFMETQDISKLFVFPFLVVVAL